MKTNRQKKAEIPKVFKRAIVHIVYDLPDSVRDKDFDCMFDHYMEDKVAKCLNFSVRNQEFSFDSLERLSKLLGTTKINFRPTGQHWELGEYTQGTDGILNLYCYEVKFPND